MQVLLGQLGDEGLEKLDGTLVDHGQSQIRLALHTTRRYTVKLEVEGGNTRANPVYFVIVYLVG